MSTAAFAVNTADMIKALEESRGLSSPSSSETEGRVRDSCFRPNIENRRSDRSRNNWFGHDLRRSHRAGIGQVRLSTAYHEAGHAVIAVRIGLCASPDARYVNLFAEGEGYK